MSHLDEGTIIAMRDGTLLSTDVHLHVEACSTCREALESAKTRAEKIAGDLATLDVPSDIQAAKVRVRAKMDATRSSEKLRHRPRWYVGRAAALLLLTAGAAYAIPGSPMRSWLSPRSSGGAEQLETQPPVPQEALTGGIEVGVPDGRIRVTVRGMAPGSEIEVVWLDTPTARISAAPGSTYSFAEGHAEATVTAGPVRVEVPRTASMISIQVNGRIILQRSEEGLELPGRVMNENNDRILFAISTP